MLSDFQIMVNGSSPVPYFYDYGSQKYIKAPDLTLVDGYIEYEFLHYFKYLGKYYCGYSGSKFSALITASDYNRMRLIVEEKSLKNLTKKQLSMIFL
jgi:hypothetical protein